MSTPNHAEIVNQVFARGGWTLSSKEGAGAFCEAVVSALHAVDPEWGHLKKSGAQNQFNGHAVDAALYRATGNTADFIYAAGDADARPSWGVNEDDHYPASSWVAPAPPAPGVDQFRLDLEALYATHHREPPSLAIIELHRTNPGGLAAIEAQLTLDDPVVVPPVDPPDPAPGLDLRAAVLALTTQVALLRKEASAEQTGTLTTLAGQPIARFTIAARK